jgi:uncharacterized metal-binding protein
LVYSCSGVSNLAQMANAIALSLHREGLATMSCIAGVGGDVKALVRVATTERPIVALDGCPLQCVKSCLARHDVEPTVHHVFTDFGIRKRANEDFDRQQAADVREQVVASLAQVAAVEAT